MNNNFLAKKEQLVNMVAAIDGVRAIGQTGDISEVPKPGESDIDIFVLCDLIPSSEQRKSAYSSNIVSQSCEMDVCTGGHWGTGDIFMVDGVEVMFMYFTIEETWNYICSILTGNHLENENGFYPIGRLATLNNINILYDDKNVLEEIKEKLSNYPSELATKMIHYHKARIIDEEDLGRVILRKDILFYHQVLETSLDHFLQVIYALNKTYFPSRKRSEKYIDSFSRKPSDCYNRIINVISLGANKNSMENSVKEWFQLVKELEELCIG